MLHIDWPRRYKLMRMHTACHLLSVVCPYPITGASVSEDDSRVDFDMSETIDKDEVTAKLMELVNANHPVFLQWITDEDLAANPGIVKSKNVRPPMGLGRVSLVCIGENSAIDSQPAAERMCRKRRKSAQFISRRSRKRVRKTAGSEFDSARPGDAS